MNLPITTLLTSQHRVELDTVFIVKKKYTLKLNHTSARDVLLVQSLLLRFPGTPFLPNVRSSLAARGIELDRSLRSGDSWGIVDEVAGTGAGGWNVCRGCEHTVAGSGDGVGRLRDGRRWLMNWLMRLGCVGDGGRVFGHVILVAFLWTWDL